MADIVLYLKNGLASILKNNYGPPGLTLPFDRLNIYDLLRYNNSSQVVILPPNNEHHHSHGPLSTYSIHGHQSEAEMAETIVEEELQDKLGIETNTPEFVTFIDDVENKGGDGSFH